MLTLTGANGNPQFLSVDQANDVRQPQLSYLAVVRVKTRSRLLLGIAQVGQDSQHFIAGQVSSMMSDFVSVDGKSQFTSIFGQLRVGASKLTTFQSCRFTACRSAAVHKLRTLTR